MLGGECSVGCSWTAFREAARRCFLRLYRRKKIQPVAAKRSTRATIPMLKPMMGPLSEFGSEWPGAAGLAVPSGGGVEWIGILVWIEAGNESSGGWLVVVDVEVCVGVNDDDEDDDEEESRWRFTKRWCWSSAAA